MQQNFDLFKILFIDIETVPMCQVYDELPDNLKPLWDHKSQRILKPNEEKTSQELFFEKAGIFAEFGKVVCVSAGFFRMENDKLSFRVKAFYGHDEKALLNDFSNMLNQHFNTSAHCLCAHNGKEFDFPYLSRRMLINNVKIPFLLNNQGKKPWEVSLIDTMELWKFGDIKNYTSLALLAAVFDIPSPKDDIDGSQVADVYYNKNELERIATYCNKDVITTARLYLKLIQSEDVEDSCIISL
ncbi:MAG: 3'-5' exonuclease [Bacteroidales bacterium]